MLKQTRYQVLKQQACMVSKKLTDSLVPFFFLDMQLAFSSIFISSLLHIAIDL
jgi:hypothetical protein